MFSLFKRAGGASSQIGVFVTSEGVAAAQLSNTGTKPRLERCVYERKGDTDPVARVLSRLPGVWFPVVANTPVPSEAMPPAAQMPSP